MDNMHMKESWNHSEFIFVIKNYYRVYDFFWKKSNLKKKKIEFKGWKSFERKFFKKIFQPPQKNLILEWFLTPKMKITWSFCNSASVHYVATSSQSCFEQIPTPLFRLKGGMYLLYTVLEKRRIPLVNKYTPWKYKLSQYNWEAQGFPSISNPQTPASQQLQLPDCQP